MLDDPAWLWNQHGIPITGYAAWSIRYKESHQSTQSIESINKEIRESSESLCCNEAHNLNLYFSILMVKLQ